MVILSDDEDEASELQVVSVKMESFDTSDMNAELDTNQTPQLIDLTDEAFEDAEAPRHYISWLTTLIQKAKINPTSMEHRLEVASISTDIIVIEDPEDNREATQKIPESHESEEAKVKSTSIPFRLQFDSIIDLNTLD